MTALFLKLICWNVLKAYRPREKSTRPTENHLTHLPPSPLEVDEDLDFLPEGWLAVVAPGKTRRPQTFQRQNKHTIIPFGLKPLEPQSYQQKQDPVDYKSRAVENRVSYTRTICTINLTPNLKLYTFFLKVGFLNKLKSTLLDLTISVHRK